MSRLHPSPGLTPRGGWVAVVVGLVLTHLTVVAVSVLTPSPALAIAHGDPAPDGGYSFVARLALFGTAEQRLSSPSSVCSGALIAPQWVITAGHCFREGGQPHSGRPSGAPTATVGRTDVSGADGHTVPIVEVRQAPTSDVAMARLGVPVTDVVPLGLTTTAPEVGQVLRIAGWGMTGAAPASLTTRLMTGQVRATTVSGTTLGVTGYAPNVMTGACLSDSGAPYFLERTDAQPLLVAVESDGPDCPHDQEETTSRVDVLGAWITSTMASPPPAASLSAAAVPAVSGVFEKIVLDLWAVGGLGVLGLTIGGWLLVLVRRQPSSRW